MAQLKNVVRQQPDAVKVWLRLGEMAMQTGNAAEAVAYFQQTITLVPDDPFIAGNLAWILATAPDDTVRDGQRARLCSLWD